MITFCGPLETTTRSRSDEHFREGWIATVNIHLPRFKFTFLMLLKSFWRVGVQLPFYQAQKSKKNRRLNRIKYQTTYLFRLQTDIHLGTEEWDRLLTGKEWEPEMIVAKLPDFLHFVREVQDFISENCENET